MCPRIGRYTGAPPHALFLVVVDPIEQVYEQCRGASLTDPSALHTYRCSGAAPRARYLPRYFRLISAEAADQVERELSASMRYSIDSLKSTTIAKSPIEIIIFL